MKKILIFALLLRLAVAPFFYHPDALDQLNWAKDLTDNGYNGFYLRDIPDAGPPNYPPLYFIIISAYDKIYDTVKNLLWSLNVNLLIFPSDFYIWFESDVGRIFFNKLLPILCDLGIGLLIYKILREYNSAKLSKSATLLYLFLPPSWYISSVWGQTDSLFILPLIFAYYLAICKKDGIWSVLFFTISFLIKPLAILAFPALFAILLKFKKRQVVEGMGLSLLVFLLSNIPFGLSLVPAQAFYFYLNNIREISGYVSSNAFNFWSIVFGFGTIRDSALWFTIPALVWGLIITGLFTIYYVLIIIKKRDYFTDISATGLSLFAMFLFLTRMHERYFYLPYIFLILLSILAKMNKWIIFIFTFIFIINLYHFWWVPGGDLFKYILSNRLVETLFCLAYILLFFYLERIREKISYDKQNIQK